jgi:hypothetical protein
MTTRCRDVPIPVQLASSWLDRTTPRLARLVPPKLASLSRPLLPPTPLPPLSYYRQCSPASHVSLLTINFPLLYFSNLFFPLAPLQPPSPPATSLQTDIDIRPTARPQSIQRRPLPLHRAGLQCSTSTTPDLRYPLSALRPPPPPLDSRFLASRQRLRNQHVCTSLRRSQR